MKKKEIKKTKLKPRKKAEIMSGQFGVLLERMDHKFDLLTEGFSGVRKDIKRLDKKIDDNHKETNANFKTLFEFRSEMIGFRNETGSNFKTTFEYLSQIDDELRSIRTEVEDLKIKLKGKAELSRVILLEERLVVTEKRLETMMF